MVLTLFIISGWLGSQILLTHKAKAAPLAATLQRFSRGQVLYLRQ